ncbi:unnamed protein product [Adineta steineri]|uniref:Uncharacterized protein n=1 Tax=Adineta steineri TaxID=433720 RepID=A0A819U4G6_9BILA|nr:unnamed protein product [Adineta steineri]
MEHDKKGILQIVQIQIIKKTNQSSEQTKTSVIDETNSSLEKPKITNEEVAIKKSNETSALTATTEVLAKEIGKLNDSSNGISANTKQHANKDQQNYHQDQRYQNQQAPHHRNNYARTMQGNLSYYPSCFSSDHF